MNEIMNLGKSDLKVCSLDRYDLFVPRARTSMAQTRRAFAIIGPSLWNQLLPSTRSTLLTGEPVLFVLSRLLSSLWVSRTGSVCDWCALQEALYKCIDTIHTIIMVLAMLSSVYRDLVIARRP